MVKLGAVPSGKYGVMITLELAGIQDIQTFSTLLQVIAISGFTVLENGNLMCRLSKEQAKRLSVVTSEYVNELTFLGLLRGGANAV